MKKMKRTLSLVLTLLVATTLVACGGSKTDSNSAANTADLNAPGTFPVSKTKQTIKVLIPWSIPGDINKMWDTTEFEKKTNIHVEWQVVPGQSFKEKRSVILASGDLPDVIINGPDSFSFSPAEQMQYGSQGLFLDLTPYIDKDTVYLKKKFQDNPQAKKIITSLDGKIYALPDFNEAFHANYSEKMWINTTWLNKLNLKMPTTTDEFEKVLLAFKNDDPNGNGKKDEKPLIFVKDAWNGSVDGFLMNAFTYDNGDTRLQLNNGKIEFAPTKPAFKDGLAYISKLYKEGLIDPASFTTDKASLKKLNESGDRTVVGASAGGTNSALGGGLSVSQRFAEYDIMPPLAGPTGFKTAANYQNFRDVTPGVFEITKACKNPDMVMRWIDWMYSEEGTIFHGLGEEGKDWKKADAGQLGLNGQQAKIQPLARAKDDPMKDKVIWQGLFPSNATKAYRESFAAPKTWKEDLKNPMSGERQLYDGSLPYEKVAPKQDQTVPPINVAADKVSDFVRIQNDINTYVKESIAKFVTGSMDVEKDWGKFQDQLKKLGLDDYLKMCQETYDKVYK